MTDLETSHVGTNLVVGSVFGGDKQILSVSCPDFSIFSFSGTGNGAASNISYAGGVSSGDALGILWINQASSVIVDNVEFGIYTSPTVVMPDDPANVTLVFLEERFGGIMFNGSLVTTNTTIPEPFTSFLGVLGAFALLLRRRV